MNYKLHLLYVNRPDLLRDALDSVKEVFAGRIHVWHSGPPAPFAMDGVQFHMLPPMPFSSAFNHLMRASWDDDLMFWMHNDAIAYGNSSRRLLEMAEQVWNEHPRWSYLCAAHDTMCAYNMKCVRCVGFVDQMFWAYTSDPDWFCRAFHAGWPAIESGLGAVSEYEPDYICHRGGRSNTIKADKLHDHQTQYRVRFDKEYYQFKWGGMPNAEKYFYPFDALPVTWLLENAPDEVRANDGSETVTAQIYAINEWILRMQPQHGAAVGGSKRFDYLFKSLMAGSTLEAADSQNIVATNHFDMVHINERLSVNNMRSIAANGINCLFINDSHKQPLQSIGTNYHLIEPYGFQRDDHRLMVALKKGLQ